MELLCWVEAALDSSEEVTSNLGPLPARTQRGRCVEAPVAPSRASQAVLEKHANNRLKKQDLKKKTNA